VVDPFRVDLQYVRDPLAGDHLARVIPGCHKGEDLVGILLGVDPKERGSIAEETVVRGTHYTKVERRGAHVVGYLENPATFEKLDDVVDLFGRHLRQSFLNLLAVQMGQLTTQLPTIRLLEDQSEDRLLV